MSTIDLPSLVHGNCVFKSKACLARFCAIAARGECGEQDKEDTSVLDRFFFSIRFLFCSFLVLSNKLIKKTN